MSVELIFEKSGTGQNSYRLPDLKFTSAIKIDEEFLRKELPLPDCGEPEVVRHYNNLSRMNFGVDNGMYPLGSCTMKYNPKINERLARNPQFSSLHPMCGDENSQGALRILFELGEYLKLITGLGGFTLAPAAGSHGELTGVMIIKKYFESTGEKRGTILIPDSAHGTNPASVAMCGFRVKEVPSTPDGDVDFDSFMEMLDGDVAAMMLTCPNTLGLFDRNIMKIADALHKNGSLFYGDGANLNALIGRVKFRDIGFDLMHINLHKTFSTPHGGGGPGSGPLGAADHLVRFLPVPAIIKDGEHYREVYDRPETIGRIHTFYGNFSICLRAYIYIRILGCDGLREISDISVLNANYLMSKLKDVFNLPIKRTCMHEFILNDKGLPNGITTNDISKRILDYGFHSPTVYFPLLVHGAMMIEPAETESFASLEKFISIMKRIREECDSEPEKVLGAPLTTPVRRVDTVLAAKKPVLKWGD